METLSLDATVAVATYNLKSVAVVTLARSLDRLRVTATEPGAYTVTAIADYPGDDFGPVLVNVGELRRALAAAGDLVAVALVGRSQAPRVQFDGQVKGGAVRVHIAAAAGAMPEAVSAGTNDASWNAVPATEPRRAIYAVLPYVAPDDNRWGLNGLHAEADPGGGHLLLGVDGNRLCAARVTTWFPALPKGTLIRRAVAGLLSLDVHDGPVIMEATAGHLVYSSPNLRVTSTLLKADFPDWRKVLPTSWPRRADLGATTLRAITRAACEIGGHEANTTVRLDIRHDCVRASCRCDDLRCEAMIEGAANFEGAVGLNARFLATATRDLAGARVTLEMSDNPLGPVRVRDADDPDGPLVIVMPVRID